MRHADIGPDRRMQLTVVSGFLGAGKSTWLAGAFGRSERRPRLLLNDVGAGMPDIDLFAGFEVSVLLGGCVCRERQGDLVAALHDLCDQRHGGAACDAIVLETSGLADPSAVTETIRRDPVLANNVVVREVVVVVDAQRVVSGLRHEPLVVRQLAGADRVVVAKTDLVTHAQAEAAIGAVHAAAPTATIEVAPNPHRIDPAAVPARPVSSSAAPAEAAVGVVTLPIAVDEDWATVATWLAALLHAHGDAIVRVKGLVPAHRGPLVLNAVAGVMHAPRPLAPASGVSQYALVVVARGLDPGRFVASWAAFRAGARPPVLVHPLSEVC